jgi:hypothetical protein
MKSLPRRYVAGADESVDVADCYDSMPYSSEVTNRQRLSDTQFSDVRDGFHVARGSLGGLETRCPKRIDDAQAFVPRHAVLNVLRSQRVVTGVNRCGGDHGVMDGKAVPLGEPAR